MEFSMASRFLKINLKKKLIIWLFLQEYGKTETPHEWCCVIFKNRTPSNSMMQLMHYISVIKIFLENCIQIILNSGIGVPTTKKI